MRAVTQTVTQRKKSSSRYVNSTFDGTSKVMLFRSLRLQQVSNETVSVGDTAVSLHSVGGVILGFLACQNPKCQVLTKFSFSGWDRGREGERCGRALPRIGYFLENEQKICQA